MDKGNITKRVYFTVSIVMLLILFMFQFSGIIRRKYNDYDINTYAADTKTTFTRSGAYLPATDERKVTNGNTRYVSFVGDIDSDCGITVYEWCRYTKRNLCMYTTLEDVTINEHNLPQALLVDAKFINFSKQLDKLQSFADMGITVVFCTLPSYDDFLGNTLLRDFCGISLVAQNIKTVGYKLYEGFLFGGETWYLPENKEQEEMYQDLKLEVPWYQTTNSTKTYMSAIVDPSRYEYLKNEEQPPVVWSKRHENGYVFCINGGLMEDISGIAILDCIMYETHDYEIYPVVDAETFVINAYPLLSFENDDTIKKFYSRNMESMLTNLMWPEISNLIDAVGSKATFMPALQLQYKDDIQPSISSLFYFFRLMNEKSAEAGLTTTRRDNISVKDKIEADYNTYNSYLNNYSFLSIMSKRSEVQEILDNHSSIFKNLRTIVAQKSDGNAPLFAYGTEDILILDSLINGRHYTYFNDYRQKCFYTALAYTGIELDMSNEYYPDDEKKLWDKSIKQISTALTLYTKSNGFLNKCTVSEADKLVREFMATNYESSMQEDTIHLKVNGKSLDSRFVLRVHNKEIANVTGADYIKIEDGAYILRVYTNQHDVTIELKDYSR
ncbi:MAG: DUF2194 domain-containing protein [Lachnospira sp.]|jgi:hypothetical protein|nr:DUF2194 domain-containing protein [Lachnospira sp.]